MVKTLKSKVKTRWWLEFANPKAMFISSQRQLVRVYLSIIKLDYHTLSNKDY